MATKPIAVVLTAEDRTKAAFSSMRRQVDQTSRSLNSLRGAMAGGFVGVVAGSAVTKFIRETMAAEQEQAQLAAVLRSTGEAAGWSRVQLNEMAESLAKNSTFSAGEINNAQTRLLAYTDIVGKAVPETMQAILDMSARTGQSVEQSAEMLGKAINLPSAGMTSLKKMGFDFGEEHIKAAKKLEAAGKVYEAQQIVLSELTSSYGGAAKAARDTFGGAITALQNNINSLLTGDEGSMKQLKESVEGLNSTLTSDDTKSAFRTLVGWMSDVSVAAIKAGVDVMEFATSAGKGRILGDYAMSEFGVGGRRKGRDLAYTNAKAARADIAAAGQIMASDTRSEAEKERAKKLLDESAAALAYWEAQMRRDAAPKFADPRLLGDPGSIASQVAAMRGPAAGGPASSTDKKGAKRDPEADAKRAITALEKQLEKTQELSEVEMALEDIRRIRAGGGTVTEAQKQSMLRLAAEIDASKSLSEWEKQRLDEAEREAERHKAIREEGIQLMERMRTPLERYNAEVKRLNELLASNAISAETHGRAVLDAKSGYEQAEEALKKVNDKMDTFGQRAAEGIQSQLGDGLYQALSGNFDNIGQAWADMLKRMLAEALAAKLSRSLFGDLVDGGKGSGWLGAVIKGVGALAGGSAIPTSVMSSANVIGSAGGDSIGYLNSILGWTPKLDTGTNYVPKDMLAVIHEGEAVIPKKYNHDGAGGGSVTFAPTYQIDGTADRAASLAAMQRIAAQANAQLIEQLKRSKVMPA